MASYYLHLTHSIFMSAGEIWESLISVIFALRIIGKWGCSKAQPHTGIRYRYYSFPLLHGWKSRMECWLTPWNPTTVFGVSSGHETPGWDTNRALSSCGLQSQSMWQETHANYIISTCLFIFLLLQSFILMIKTYDVIQNSKLPITWPSGDDLY